MPRRRKSVHSNKAPLIFTESPVNKQSNVPSPIYCARHPLTAKSVPVEDLHDLTWVSPQFQDNIGSIRKVKKHRKSRIVSGPKCTCHCGSNPYSLRVNGTNNKFKPLKFIGEKTPPATIIEDLSFSEDEQENISQQSVSPCLNRSQTVLKRKSRSSRSKKRSLTIPKNKHLTDNDKKKLKHSEDFDETCNNLNVGNMSVLTPVTNVIARDVHREPVVHSETISQSGDVLNEDDDTQTPIYNITCKSPVKRLFTSLKNSPETNVFTFIKNRNSSKKDDKHSNRLLKNLYVSLCSSPSQSNKNVLVADTPEAEYGIPYRLRRFRHKKKNDNT